MSTKKTKKYYCNNKELLKELKKYKDTDEMSEQLGEMFIEIATRFSNRSDWCRYDTELKKDFIGEALYRMVSQAHKFDITRFTYLLPIESDSNETKYESRPVYIKNDNDIVTINRKNYQKNGLKLINIKNDDDTISIRSPNPFAYFSQIVYHIFVMQAKKHYKQINIKRDICEQYLEEIECSDHMDRGSFLKQVLQEKVDELN